MSKFDYGKDVPKKVAELVEQAFYTTDVFIRHTMKYNSKEQAAQILGFIDAEKQIMRNALMKLCRIVKNISAFDPILPYRPDAAMDLLVSIYNCIHVGREAAKRADEIAKNMIPVPLGANGFDDKWKMLCGYVAYPAVTYLFMYMTTKGEMDFKEELLDVKEPEPTWGGKGTGAEDGHEGSV